MENYVKSSHCAIFPESGHICNSTANEMSCYVGFVLHFQSFYGLYRHRVCHPTVLKYLWREVRVNIFRGCAMVMYEFTRGVKTAFELCQMSLLAPIGSSGPEGQRIGHAKTSHGR